MSDAPRKARLNYLIKNDYETAGKFVAATRIGKARVSQMCSPNHAFGEKAGITLAEKLELPERWFENEWPTPKEAKLFGLRPGMPYPADTKAVQPIQDMSLNDLIRRLGNTLKAVDRTDLSIAALIFKDLCDNPDRVNEMADKFDRLLGGVLPHQDEKQKKFGN